MKQVHFKEDSRCVLIAEEFETIVEAEEAADHFLEEMAAVDEAGTRYLRVQVSGMPDAAGNGTYYFDVVTLL